MVPALQIRRAIERFLEAAKTPALMEAGEESMALAGDNLLLEDRAQTVVLQAWDDHRNLVRRITAIESESRGRLELRFERFAKKTGTLTLLDLNRGGRQQLELRTSRLEFREQFRLFLKRQFPSHKIATLSTEAHLEESLSPAYARALIREGTSAWAAMGAGPDSLNPNDVLSFGLIWLDYLRRTEHGLTVQGLILLLPAGREKTTCLRLKWLNSQIAEYRAFAFSEDGIETMLDLRDYGNLDTRLEPVRRRMAGRVDQLMAPIVETGGIETIDLPAGDVSYRIHGLEFARTAGDTLLTGIDTKRVTTASSNGDVERFASELARLRSVDARDRLNPLYLRGRELWLESQVRANLEDIDACLRPTPVYGQAPTFACSDRGVIDLLAVGYDGHLAILELKASQDIHLPLQALDYWIRVKWHLERGEFEPAGYFPGIPLRPEPPRVLLIAPALEFHPSNGCVLRYFSPAIEVERIGVGVEWQRELKIMFKM